MQQIIEFVVDSWEIECCARPPVVGERATWALQWITPTVTTEPVLIREVLWSVSDAATLIDGPVAAAWCTVNGPPPAAGIRTLRGYLCGTVHDTTPSVSGFVTRVRLLEQRYVLTPDRVVQPVPGTLRLTDVPEAPLTFECPAPEAVDNPDNPPWETAVLVELAVDRP